jgi:hypothetical protein
MPMVTRYVDFLKADLLSADHKSITLCIEALCLRPSSTLQYAGILKRCVDKPLEVLEMHMKGLRKEKVMTPVRQAKAMTYDDHVRIRNALKNPRHSLLFRVAWLRASRWSDVEFPPPLAFPEHMVDPTLLIVNFWYHPRSFESEADRPGRYAVLEGEDAAVIRQVLKTLPMEDEPVAQRTTAQMAQALKPHGYTNPIPSSGERWSMLQGGCSSGWPTSRQVRMLFRLWGSMGTTQRRCYAARRTTCSRTQPC